MRVRDNTLLAGNSPLGFLYRGLSRGCPEGAQGGLDCCPGDVVLLLNYIEKYSFCMHVLPYILS